MDISNRSTWYRRVERLLLKQVIHKDGAFTAMGGWFLHKINHLFCVFGGFLHKINRAIYIAIAYTFTVERNSLSWGEGNYIKRKSMKLTARGGAQVW